MTMAFVLGAVAGLRTMTAPAAVSWAAVAGWLVLDGTWLALLAAPWAAAVLTLLALGELIADKLPFTPSRTLAGPFAGRLISGAVCGAAIGFGIAAPIAGLAAGIAGAIAGTVGGHAARRRLAAAFGRDWPAALLEDAVAVVIALVTVLALG